MGYQEYGISKELVERLKLKAKQPEIKKRLKELMSDVTKADLQNRAKVRKLVSLLSAELKEPVNERDKERIVNFVLDHKIDPQNTFHYLKLWSMFH